MIWCRNVAALKLAFSLLATDCSSAASVCGNEPLIPDNQLMWPHGSQQRLHCDHKPLLTSVGSSISLVMRNDVEMTGKSRDKVMDATLPGSYIAGNFRKGPFMRQPELGKKILELRKEKGLTQEELVEKCNISVMTLQRIETGEVTPRVFTIRTILAALDYDLGTIAEDEVGGTRAPASTLRKYLLLESDSTDFLYSQLTVAWVSGILYFMLGLFEGAADIVRLQEDRLIAGEAYYVVMKVAVLVTYVLFLGGFVALGGLTANYLLRITSFVLIIGNAVVIGYDIASVFHGPTEDAFILGMKSFTYGGIMIVWRCRVENPLIYGYIAASSHVPYHRRFLSLIVSAAPPAHLR